MNFIFRRNLKRAVALFWLSSILSCSDQSPKLATSTNIPQKKASDAAKGIEAVDPQVDILIVIANDSSMAQHDDNLTANAALFTSQILKNKIVDYHIGVITGMSTDQNLGAWGGRLTGSPAYVERSTPNPVQALQQNMNLGHDADDPVALFTVTEQALTPPISLNENAGFLRPGADLVVMYFSDTDPEDRGPSAAQIYKFLVDLKGGNPKKVSIYAAYAPDPRTCSGEGDPKQLNALLKLATGNSFGFSLCDPNFGTQLAKISNRIADSVKKTFELSRLPVPETITVTYGGLAIPNDADKGWSYDPERNSVTLGPNLVLPSAPVGSKLEINYTIASGIHR